VASWREQTLIDAPVRDVWALLEDPVRYPEWNPETVAVTGAPTEIEKGSTFTLTGRSPLGMTRTTEYRVEALEEPRELRMRCQASGFYSRWVLTSAQGRTFAEVELGVEPIGLQGRVAEALHTKRYLRRAAEETLDNLRAVMSGG